MQSRTDTAGHTKAFDYPVIGHCGESQVGQLQVQCGRHPFRLLDFHIINIMLLRCVFLDKMPLSPNTITNTFSLSGNTIANLLGGEALLYGR